MSDRDELLDVLRARLLTVEGLYDVVWFGMNTPTPSITTPYIEEQPAFGPEYDTGPAIGGVRWRRTTGSYQLTICVPKSGSALQAALNMATLIENAFLETNQMTFSSGAPLVADSTQILSPRDMSSWLKLPVLINYTFTTNA